jgi:hypothetical protein
VIKGRRNTIGQSFQQCSPSARSTTARPRPTSLRNHSTDKWQPSVVSRDRSDRWRQGFRARHRNVREIRSRSAKRRLAGPGPSKNETPVRKVSRRCGEIALLTSTNWRNGEHDLVGGESTGDNHDDHGISRGHYSGRFDFVGGTGAVDAGKLSDANLALLWPRRFQTLCVASA